MDGLTDDILLYIFSFLNKSLTVGAWSMYAHLHSSWCRATPIWMVCRQWSALWKYNFHIYLQNTPHEHTVTWTNNGNVVNIRSRDMLYVYNPRSITYVYDITAQNLFYTNRRNTALSQMFSLEYSYVYSSIADFKFRGECLIVDVVDIQIVGGSYNTIQLLNASGLRSYSTCVLDLTRAIPGAVYVGNTNAVLKRAGQTVVCLGGIVSVINPMHKFIPNGAFVFGFCFSGFSEIFTVYISRTKYSRNVVITYYEGTLRLYVNGVRNLVARLQSHVSKMWMIIASVLPWIKKWVIADLASNPTIL